MTVKIAKDVIKVDLKSDLINFKRCYSKVAEIFDHIESRSYSISRAVYELRISDFCENPAEIKQYLNKRIAKKRFDLYCRNEKD